jgi:hypothetical protein
MDIPKVDRVDGLFPPHLLFFIVSLSAAFLGWGMVVVASRIEHEHPRTLR